MDQTQMPPIENLRNLVVTFIAAYHFDLGTQMLAEPAGDLTEEPDSN